MYRTVGQSIDSSDWINQRQTSYRRSFGRASTSALLAWRVVASSKFPDFHFIFHPRLLSVTVGLTDGY